MSEWADQERQRMKNARKAKNVPLDEWLVASDKVREENPKLDVSSDYLNQKRALGRTFRYVPKGVIEELAKYLPCRKWTYRVNRNTERETWMFPNDLIFELLIELDLPVEKYSRMWWNFNK